MNVAITSPWDIDENSIGGTERFIKDLADGLTLQGNNVTIFTLGINSWKYNNVNIIGTKFFNEPVNENILFKYFNYHPRKSLDNIQNHLVKHIYVNYFDVIHHNSFVFGEYGDKKSIHTIHSNPFELRMTYGNNCFNEFVNLFSQSSSKLIAPSMNTAKLYQGLLGRCPGVIPHAYSDRLHLIDNSKYIREKFDIDINNIVLFFPSRLEFVIKQQDKALKSILLLPKDILKKITIIFGGNDHQYLANQTTLKSMSSSANLTIKFINFSDMSEGYSISDIILLTSSRETFGYAALESLMLDKLTILTSIPSFQEIAGNSKTAYFIDPQLKNLDKQLIFLIKNLTILKKNKNGKDWKINFSLDEMINRYTKLYVK